VEGMPVFRLRSGEWQVLVQAVCRWMACTAGSKNRRRWLKVEAWLALKRRSPGRLCSRKALGVGDGQSVEPSSL